MKENTKTLAFQISTELSDRVKATLERHAKYHHRKLTLKEFGIRQLIKGVEESEAEERERLANMTEEEKMRASYDPFTGEYGYVPAGYRPDGTRIVEEIPADDGDAPAEEAPAAEDGTPAEDGAPTEEATPAAEDGAHTEEEAPAAEDGTHTGEEAPADEGDAPTREEAPAAEDGTPTEEEAPAAEDGAHTEEEAPAAEDGAPIGEEAPTTEEKAPIVKNGRKPAKGGKKTSSRGRKED